MGGVARHDICCSSGSDGCMALCALRTTPQMLMQGLMVMEVLMDELMQGTDAETDAGL